MVMVAELKSYFWCLVKKIGLTQETHIANLKTVIRRYKSDLGAGFEIMTSPLYISFILAAFNLSLSKRIGHVVMFQFVSNFGTYSMRLHHDILHFLDKV